MNSHSIETSFINFRKISFNHEADEIMNDIYNMVLHFNKKTLEERFRHRLLDLNFALIKYYEDLAKINIPNLKTPTKNDSPQVFRAFLMTKMQITENAEKTFSQFRQNLIYYIIHNSRVNPAEIQTAVEIIITHKSKNNHRLFYIDRNKEPMAWIDPKEKYSVLTSAVRFHNFSVVKSILQETEVAFKNNLQGFFAFISQRDKHGFTALDMARVEGCAAIAELLLDAARLADDTKKLPILNHQASVRSVIIPKHASRRDERSYHPYRTASSSDESNSQAFFSKNPRSLIISTTSTGFFPATKP